jgi:hypothetical protein
LQTAYWTLPFGESVLQIQSGRFEIPAATTNTPPTVTTQPVYSRSFNLLLSYLLTPDQVVRPDVYQFSELLHGEILKQPAGPNPVPNLSNSKAPLTLDEIEKMKVNRALEEVKRAETNAAAAATAAASLVVLETSVTPRQRPKGLNAALPKSPNIERKIMWGF